MGLAIIGFPRSGKTTLGKKVADELGAPFFDTDVMIEAVSGMSRRNCFETMGERAFRELECDMLAQIPEGAVVATGGGIILSRESRMLLGRFPRIVYLDVPVTVLKKRLKAAPLPAVCGTVEQLIKTRLPLYKEVATEVWHGA